MTARREDDVKAAINLALPLDQSVVNEGDLIKALVRDNGFSVEEIQDGLHTLQARNEIRWVAYRGWSRGGRPGS